MIGLLRAFFASLPPQEAPWWRLLQGHRGPRQGDGRMADGLLEAVRGLHLAHPELGPKPLPSRTGRYRIPLPY